MAKPFYGVDGNLLVEDLPYNHDDVESGEQRGELPGLRGLQSKFRTQRSRSSRIV
jgi:hypothetical protein